LGYPGSKKVLYCWSQVSSTYCETSLFKAIEYENIFSAFILLAIGIFISLSVFAYELWHGCAQKNGKELKNK